MLIQVGTDEVLLDDSRELAIRMDAQGVDVDIDIYEGMWHVWHMYDVPEANMAVDKIHWFVHVTLKIGGLEKRSVHVGPSTGISRGNATGCFPWRGTAKRWRRWWCTSSSTGKRAYGYAPWRCF